MKKIKLNNVVSVIILFTVLSVVLVLSCPTPDPESMVPLPIKINLEIVNNTSVDLSFDVDCVSVGFKLFNNIEEIVSDDENYQRLLNYRLDDYYKDKVYNGSSVLIPLLDNSGDVIIFHSYTLNINSLSHNDKLNVVYRWSAIMRGDFWQRDLLSQIIRLNIGGVEYNIAGWPEYLFSDPSDDLSINSYESFFYKFVFEKKLVDYYNEYINENVWKYKIAERFFALDQSGDVAMFLDEADTMNLRITVNSADDVRVEVIK